MIICMNSTHLKPKIPMTKNFVFVFLALLILTACSIVLTNLENEKNHIQYETFSTKNGWGYNILMNNKIVIHQQMIPAANIEKGFNSKEEAAKVAMLVITKIRMKKFPGLTAAEVQTLISENGFKH